MQAAAGVGCVMPPVSTMPAGVHSGCWCPLCSAPAATPTACLPARCCGLSIFTHHVNQTKYMSIVRESEHHEHFACLPACLPRHARLLRARPGGAGCCTHRQCADGRLGVTRKNAVCEEKAGYHTWEGAERQGIGLCCAIKRGGGGEGGARECWGRSLTGRLPSSKPASQTQRPAQRNWPCHRRCRSGSSRMV